MRIAFRPNRAPRMVDIESIIEIEKGSPFSGIERESIAFYYAAAWALEYVTSDDIWDDFMNANAARRRQLIREPDKFRKALETMSIIARSSAAYYYNMRMGSDR